MADEKSALAFQLRGPTCEQGEGGGVVRGHGVDEETAIGGYVVLSADEIRRDDACLEKHPRRAGRFMLRVKAHCHQFPVRRNVEDLLAIPGPRGLCSTARDFEASTGTWKGLDEDT